MPTAIKLDHRKPITYSSAMKKDSNIISRAAYFQAATEQIIQALVRHHLRLSTRDTCIVNAKAQWIRGSFNVCIPIEVQTTRYHKKLIFRCPMPYKLAEVKYPRTVDEKLCSEVGTYAWIQDQCPDIRIPHLYGFGFSDHRHKPFYIRVWRIFQRRLRNLLRCHPLLPYTTHPTTQRLSAAYMILEHISLDTGEMLSNTWKENRNDPIRRQNLFRGIARLMLSLANIPQPRIGSFKFHADGTITLTNRPLPCSVIILENDEPFVADMLTLHENRFLSNPNAIYDASDCRGQIAAGVLLRMLSHHYVLQKHRNGPFYL
ncbi:hypothetical protein LAWI1_G004340 [Lachnellula willkommii]|uniref:Uncharacterized protein n=1 Tax=Lachnellula willkommii TaxID=215461 RepID=A0A559MDR8_9HELO|nr:hypothetical protein LAWI1_G004340 [Lachnellula willkommii]